MAEEPKKKDIPTNEEDLADEEEIKEKGEDEIRQQVIDKYGLDEIEQSDLIDQLVEDHMEVKKKLGTAIKQKRKWREEAQKKVPPKGEKSEEIPSSDVEKLLEAAIDTRLDQRDLDASGISDELKQEVRDYAKARRIRIKDALNSEYVGFLKEKEEQKKKEEEASTSFKRKSQAGRDFSKMSPKDFDLSTEEGQKGFEEYKKWLKT